MNRYAALLALASLSCQPAVVPCSNGQCQGLDAGLAAGDAGQAGGDAGLPDLGDCRIKGCPAQTGYCKNPWTLM